jgi:hypothetical protein
MLKNSHICKVFIQVTDALELIKNNPIAVLVPLTYLFCIAAI